MNQYEHFLVGVGNLLTCFFTGAIFASAEMGMKIIAFVLAAGAGGSTWYYNSIKIKQAREEHDRNTKK